MTQYLKKTFVARETDIIALYAFGFILFNECEKMF